MGDLTLYDLVCLRSFVKENIGFFHNKLSYSEVTNDEFSIKFYKREIAYNEVLLQKLDKIINNDMED